MLVFVCAVIMVFYGVYTSPHTDVLHHGTGKDAKLLAELAQADREIKKSINDIQKSKADLRSSFPFLPDGGALEKESHTNRR